jgi:hypothetical protein
LKGVDILAILPKRREKRRVTSNIKKTIALFMVFLGLSIVIHETCHLLAVKALGYEGRVDYGFQFPTIYGFVKIDPSPDNPVHRLLIYLAGGIGAGIVLFILWTTIDDTIAKLLLSFFTVMQFTYGVMEPLYGFEILDRSVLQTGPTLVGLIALIFFGIKYRKLGWW